MKIVRRKVNNCRKVALYVFVGEDMLMELKRFYLIKKKKLGREDDSYSFSKFIEDILTEYANGTLENSKDREVDKKDNDLW